MDHGKTGDGEEMCHKKMQKMMKIMKIFIFLELSQNEARSISKLSERCKMMMVRSILAHLHHWTGLRLILGVPALVRFFDPLTQYL